MAYVDPSFLMSGFADGGDWLILQRMDYSKV